MGFVERGLELLNLLLRLTEAVLLDEHGLGEDVERVRISGEALLEVTLGVEVFVSDLRVANAFDEAVDHLLLLRCHRAPLMWLPMYTIRRLFKFEEDKFGAARKSC